MLIIHQGDECRVSSLAFQWLWATSHWFLLVFTSLNMCCGLRYHPFFSQAALRQLAKNKVPNMAVVLKSILHTHADGKAVFRDPTGKAYALGCAMWT